MAKIYVFSTITADVAYTGYKPMREGQQVNVVEHSVLIKGGANVADGNFVTPEGVVTEISEEDLAHCMANPVFKLHMENGFIKVDKKDQKIEKAVSDMVKRDESAPLTEDDYTSVGKEAPKVNRDSNE